MKAIIFDTETTGLLLHSAASLSAQPHCIEFGAVIIELKGSRLERIAEISQLIKPPVPIPPDATKINGITDEMVENMPTFLQFFPVIKGMLEQCAISIAHNHPFDKTIISNEVERCRAAIDAEIVWPRIPICTAAENFARYGRRPRMQGLYRDVTGKEPQQKHRALDDVNMLAEIVLKEGYIEFAALAAAPAAK